MKSRTYTHIIGVRIGTGFFLVVMLMAALTFVGLKHMAQVNSQLKNIVENNNVKIELGQVMQDALHERALSMHSIAVLDDAFLQDDEYLRFNTMGVKYVVARQKLEALELTENEKIILEKIRILTKETQPYVQEVVELGIDNKSPLVFEKIRELAVPKQRLIAEQVNLLISIQKQQAEAALTDGRSSYQDTRKIMLFLGLVAILLGVLIGVLVIRHVMKQADLLEHQALHDELTGLANRLLFEDRLKKSILRGQRHSMSFSIMLIDLNSFKAVNDSLGHNVGDLVLKEVARRLNNSVRKMDTVARLGGDEFVIILESLELDQVVKFADKLVKSISAPFLLATHELDIGVSMGIASYPEHGHDCETLVNRADIAMYTAKRNKVPYVCYTDKLKNKKKLSVVHTS